MNNSTVVVIPAYRPDARLLSVASDLVDRGFRLVVVDDGSGPKYGSIFRSVATLPAVAIRSHAVNLGKGAALRTGMNAALVLYPDAGGVVTADADGQHLPDDIEAVASALGDHPHNLVLGVRAFSREVPLRSRVGNSLACTMVKVFMGSKLKDTQTGLRGIPAFFVRRLLRLKSSGYEFESDMLLSAKHNSIPLTQVPIATVYIEQNRSSHFRPLFDSMKVGFVLFRFVLLSLATALLDNLVFALSFFLSGSVASSQVLARMFAVVFGFTLSREAVFLSQQAIWQTVPKYLLLVAVNGFASYQLLSFIHMRYGLPILVSKILAESALFAVSFVVQRDVIFTCRRDTARRPWSVASVLQKAA